jgi:hypothetical protein
MSATILRAVVRTGVGPARVSPSIAVTGWKAGTD